MRKQSPILQKSSACAMSVFVCLVLVNSIAQLPVEMLPTDPAPVESRGSRSAPDSEPELVLVYSSTPSVLTGEVSPVSLENPFGLMEEEIIEVYDAFTLARLSEERNRQLQELGLHIEAVPHSTLSGRGSFLFDIRNGEPSIPDELALQSEKTKDETYYIAKFAGPIKDTWIDTLNSLDVEFLEYLSFFNYVVRMPTKTREIVADLDFVQWLGTYHPAYKVSTDLLSRLGTEAVNIFLFGGSDVTEAATAIEKYGGRVIHVADSGPMPRLVVDLPLESVLEVANIQAVSLIVTEDVERNFPNDVAQWVVQSGVTNQRTIWDQGIRGQGQIVANVDTGIWVTHAAFHDPTRAVQFSDPLSPNPPDNQHRKIVNYWTWGDDQDGYAANHGTHTASTNAGNDDPNGGTGQYNGMAPDAKISFADVHDLTTGLEEPDNYADLLQLTYDDGARILSGSMVCAPNGKYSVRSMEFDDFTWNNEDYLLFVAVHNYGPDPGTVCNRASAKNIVSVGMTDKGVNGVVYSDSGRGPTLDGRLKPTLVAPTNEMAASDDSWGYNSLGLVTSAATPAAAGAAVLVRQYYEDGWYPCEESDFTTSPNPLCAFNPSAALLKATLINGAVELFGSGARRTSYDSMSYPTNDQGWGRVNLDNALYFGGDKRHLHIVDEPTGLWTGQFVEYEIMVDDSSEPLEITLVWSDYPGVVDCHETACIVNDLDLTVVDPHLNEYKGNVLFSDPAIGRWQSQPNPTKSYDHLNVEENVIRFNPTPGKWTVRVSAFEASVHGPQPFALVSTGSFSEEVRQTYSTDESSQPFVASDQDGGFHMAWVEDVSGDNEIFYKEVGRHGNTITDTLQVTDATDDADGDNQFAPVVTIHGNQVYVFYADEVESPNRIYRMAGKKWDSITESWLNLNPFDSNGDPLAVFKTTDLMNSKDVIDLWRPFDVLVDNQGTFHVTFSYFETSDFPSLEEEHVMYSRNVDPITSSWEPPQSLVSDIYTPTVDPHTRRMRSPNLVIGDLSTTPPSRYLHVTYSYDDAEDPLTGPWSGDNHIQYLGGDTVNGFPSPTPLDIGVDLASTAGINTLATDDGSGVYVAWEDWDGSDIDISFNRNPSNGVGPWGTAQVVIAESGCQIRPSLDTGLGDYLHLVWAFGPQPCLEYGVFYTGSIDRGVNWHDKTQMASGPGTSTNPHIESYVVDSDPQWPRYEWLSLVWEDGRAGNTEVYYRTLPMEHRITELTQDSDSPWIAVDSTDNRHIVWVDYRRGESDIYYVKLDREGKKVSSERFPTPVATALQDRQYSPIVVVSPFNDFVFVFFGSEEVTPTSRNYYISGARSEDGGLTWQSLPMMDPSGGFFYLYKSYDLDRDLIDEWRPFDVVIDSTGIIHMIWTRYVTGLPTESEHLKYARSMDWSGQDWEAPQSLAVGLQYPDPGYRHTRRTRSPNIAIGRTSPSLYLHASFATDLVPDPIGGPYVGPSYLVNKRSTDGGSNWIQFINLATTTEVAREHTLAADGSGNVYVAWQDRPFPEVDPNHRIYFAQSDNDGSSFSDPYLASTGEDQLHPYLTVDSMENLHLVWGEDVTTGLGIHLGRLNHITSSDHGQSWDLEASRILSMPLAWFKIIVKPVLSVDSGDHISIVWQLGAGLTWDEVWHLKWL